MNEIEKRLDDLAMWLDHRIAQQVERQLEQRLAQESEYWRLTVSDLIAKERERVNELIVELTHANNEQSGGAGAGECAGSRSNPDKQ